VSLAQVERALSKGIAPVWVLWGDAQPRVDEAVARVTAAALEGIRVPAFNHGSYRAGDPSAPEVWAAARTLPMMDALRLVVVRDLQEGSVEFFCRFLDYAAEPSPSTVVVASGVGFPKPESKQPAWVDRLGTALGKNGVILSFQARDVRPVEFVEERASALGKSIDRQAARLLVELIGGDPSILASEVAKLALYVGEAPAIDVDAISAATSQITIGEVWDLTTAMAVRDRNKAVAALSRLLDGGDDPHRMLGVFAWQWRELLRYAELVRGGASDSAIQSEIKLRPEIQRAVRARIGKDFPGAATVLGRLAHAWQDMNGHKAGDRRILEGLVLELLSQAG
jgi:DNA polymerase III delta subunit